MGNTLTRVSETDHFSRSWSQLNVRSRLRRTSPAKFHRGTRLASMLFRGSDDIAEARPRRRLHKARQDAAETQAVNESNRDGESLLSRSDSGESWATARPRQNVDSDSISTTTKSPISPISSRIEDKEGVSPRKDCVICTNHLPLARFPKRPPTAVCDHTPDTCLSCLRKWVDYSFKTKVWDHIDCPECDQRLQYADVKALMNPKLAIKYDELAAKAAIEAIPGFRWCIAKKCESGQVHDGSGMPQFVCVECKMAHCVVHDMPWHTKETCAEYEYRTRGKKKIVQDKKTQKWLGKKTKKCPGCEWSIQKNGGCDHMRCAKCDCEFCYECLTITVWDVDEMEASHQPGCSNAA